MDNCNNRRTAGFARKRRRRRRVAFILAAVLIAVPVFARLCIHNCARGRIYAIVNKVPHCRVALVLGASVKPNGTLSTQLEDRVAAGVRLYKAGAVEKLLMSSDNRVAYRSGPRRMCERAIELGVPREDVAMDRAGRRTYDSVYRARHVFGLKRLVIVSQRFHLDRSLFLCDHIGVDGIGFAADVRGHRSMRAEIRELGASVAALVDVYLREPRPVMGPREPI